MPRLVFAAHRPPLPGRAAGPLRAAQSLRVICLSHSLARDRGGRCDSTHRIPNPVRTGKPTVPLPCGVASVVPPRGRVRGLCIRWLGRAAPGRDLSERADLVLGTSAGAVTGARLMCGEPAPAPYGGTVAAHRGRRAALDRRGRGAERERRVGGLSAAARQRLFRHPAGPIHGTYAPLVRGGVPQVRGGGQAPGGSGQHKGSCPPTSTERAEVRRCPAAGRDPSGRPGGTVRRFPTATAWRRRRGSPPRSPAPRPRPRCRRAPRPPTP